MAAPASAMPAVAIVTIVPVVSPAFVVAIVILVAAAVIVVPVVSAAVVIPVAIAMIAAVPVIAVIAAPIVIPIAVAAIAVIAIVGVVARGVAVVGPVGIDVVVGEVGRHQRAGGVVIVVAALVETVAAAARSAVPDRPVEAVEVARGVPIGRRREHERDEGGTDAEGGADREPDVAGARRRDETWSDHHRSAQ